jgi:hypothetical protein
MQSPPSPNAIPPGKEGLELLQEQQEMQEHRLKHQYDVCSVNLNELVGGNEFALRIVN